MVTIKIIENKLGPISHFLGFLCIVALFLYIVIYTNSEIADPDIWLHLKTGELIVGNHAVPRCDPFSFALSSRPWIDHSWLFQVITYLIYQKYDASGIIFVQSFFICLIFWVMLVFGSKKDNHIIIITALLLSLFASRTRINIRPDVFSVLFFLFFLIILKKFLDTKKVFWLIPIQIIWVNMHGYFIVGPILVLILLISEFIQARIPVLSKKSALRIHPKTHFSKLILLFFVLLSACLINPYTYQGLFYPVKVIISSITRPSQAFENIVELISPIVLQNKYNFDFSFYFYLIVLTLATILINYRRIKIFDTLVWVLLLFLSLRYARNVMFFTVFSGVILMENLNDIDEIFYERNFVKIKDSGHKLKHLLSITFKILFIVWISKTAITYVFSSGYFLFDKYEIKGKLWGLSGKAYPEKAVDFVLRNNLPKRLFNDFNSGSYLIGRCFPRRQVFIDGRTELYGPRFFKDYDSLMRADKKAIENLVEKFHIDGFFITGVPSDEVNLIKTLYKDKDFKTVYFDESAIIFLKDSAGNKDLIEKFAFDLKDWRASKIDLIRLGINRVDPYPYARRAHILEMLQLDDATVSEINEIRKISPGSFVYHSAMGNILFRKRQFMQAFEHLRLAHIISRSNLGIEIDLASCYSELGRLDKAISILRQIVKKAPESHLAYHRLALAYAKAKDYPNAIKYLKKALGLSSQNPLYHKDLAEILYKNGDYTGSLKEYREVLRLQPDNIEAKGSIKMIETQNISR
ncbi:MAG: tetratricopeptide repeat protein [Candidatus Omnitrophota bacterium]